MCGDWANRVVVGQSARIFEEWLNTGTPIADTVDSHWIAGVREVSLRFESPRQGKRWGPGCWREGSQAGKQLGWPIADHFAFLSAKERVNGQWLMGPVPFVCTEESSRMLGARFKVAIKVMCGRWVGR